MSEYQIERRQLAVCAQERSMPRYKRNKNKANAAKNKIAALSLTLPEQFFLSIHCQSAARYRETARELRAAGSYRVSRREKLSIFVL